MMLMYSYFRRVWIEWPVKEIVFSKSGTLPLSEWGSECGRGFIRDDRFGIGRVIKGTNRGRSRQWRRLDRKATQA
jgi:hypothetical protein